MPCVNILFLQNDHHRSDDNLPDLSAHFGQSARLVAFRCVE